MEDALPAFPITQCPRSYQASIWRLLVEMLLDFNATQPIKEDRNLMLR
jgi:hypothetical protein